MTASSSRRRWLGYAALLAGGVIAQLGLPWVLARAARDAEAQDSVDCHEPVRSTTTR